MNQDEIAKQNGAAWGAHSYEAWIQAYGTPEEAAAILRGDPQRKLRRILPHLENPANLKIANPLGSHGRIATALAILGADVTVFDISASNQQYALELAASAGVQIHYELGDFIPLANKSQNEFDVVVMELGVVHYFSDLNNFIAALSTLLQANGYVVLNEFHPIVNKAIDMVDGDVVLVGNYFSDNIKQADTPYSVFIEGKSVPLCAIRLWTLGEIVTAFADGGFRIDKLIEEPMSKYQSIPGTFTLVASLEM